MGLSLDEYVCIRSEVKGMPGRRGCGDAEMRVVALRIERAARGSIVCEIVSQREQDDSKFSWDALRVCQRVFEVMALPQ